MWVIERLGGGLHRKGAPYEFTVSPRKFDVLAKAWIAHDRRAGRTRHAMSKRQLASKELRRLGLVNASEGQAVSPTDR